MSLCVCIIARDTEHSINGKTQDMTQQLTHPTSSIPATEQRQQTSAQVSLTIGLRDHLTFSILQGQGSLKSSVKSPIEQND